MARMSKEQKKLAIDAVKERGTLLSGANAAGVNIKELRSEMKRSVRFKKRISEARDEGKQGVAEMALTVITSYALKPPPKTDRNQLTAAIALANAFIPGFRGAQTVQGKIDHDVRVITAIPRPKYDELPAPKVQIEEPKKRVEIRDEQGNYIGSKYESVEEAIEGEVVG